MMLPHDKMYPTIDRACDIPCHISLYMTAGSPVPWLLLQWMIHIRFVDRYIATVTWVSCLFQLRRTLCTVLQDRLAWVFLLMYWDTYSDACGCHALLIASQTMKGVHRLTCCLLDRLPRDRCRCWFQRIRLHSSFIGVAETFHSRNLTGIWERLITHIWPKRPI
jgi:hypothetical protein